MYGGRRRITLKNPNVVPIDADGDGHVNLLHMPRADQYGLYHFEEDGPGWKLVGREMETASREDVKIDFTSNSPNTKVADVNFDGLVDIVVSTGTEIQTFLSLGRYPGGDGQFGQARYDAEGELRLSNEPLRTCLPWAGQILRFEDADTRLADMNGDGIVDIVRMRAGNIVFWPGRGNGFFGTGDRNDCGSGEAAQDRHVIMSDAPYYSDPTGAGLRIDDVNGDGLSDLVQIRATGIDVWLNADGSGWTARRIISNTPFSNDLTPRVRLVDINGSGTRDILWGDAHDYKYIDLQGGKKPRLLTSVDNGLGKTSTLEYEPSTAQMLRAERGLDPFGQGWTDKMPLVTQVVKTHIERDNLGTVAGLAKREYITEYTYRDPYYDGQQREFRGFAYAEGKRIGDANSPTSITASSFLLGKCVDEDPDDGIDACSARERWRDNPREALKGLPVVSETFDEADTYLSTAHSGYRLRRLYQGLDGRDVRHAFLETSTSYVYDTAPFRAADGASEPLQTVRLEFEPELVSDGAGPEDLSSVSLRSTSGMAKLRTQSEVDWFGNQISATNRGCIGGAACPSPDEVIVQSFVPTPLPGPSGWLWRTTDTSVHGEASRGFGHGTRNETTTAFDEHGAAISTTAELSGTLGLDRFHADDEPTAPAPPAASADGTLMLSRTHYDGTFGNVTLTRGANDRCAAISYDPHYALFATSETIYPGGCGDLSNPSKPNIPAGTFALAMASAYDHGLSAPTVIVNMQGQYSIIRYDSFGRMTEMYRPHPGTAFDRSNPIPGPDDPDSPSAVGVCKLPSVVIEYELPDETGQPYSRIHTKTQDSTSCGEAEEGDDGYLHAHGYIDGFGRTLVAMAEADPDSALGDSHPWVAGGVVEYDTKAAVRRKFLPFYYDGDPEAYDLTNAPNAQYGSQRYDAFGRAVQTYDVDGTVTLTTRYHALSTDLYDAADIGPGPHAGSHASTKSDGHGRGVLVTERFHVGGKLESRFVETTYLPTNEVAVIDRYKGSRASSEKVTRWMRYDSLGRMVLNVDPNTTVAFKSVPDADVSAGTMKAWRYAYNDAGDLVGTSDARGCGVNFDYDGVGRLLSEDYSPCESHHALYSNPQDDGLEAQEVIYSYDTSAAPGGLPAPPTLTVVSESFYAGQLAAVWDRGAVRYTSFDGRGRAFETHAKIAAPLSQRSQTTGALADRYAPRWYKREMRYDSADREVWATTGAEHPELMAVPTGPGQGVAGGPSSASAVTTSYTRRNKTQDVSGSYGKLVQSIARTGDDLVTRIVYGDIAETATDFGYDFRRRLMTVQTYRGPPSEWSNADSYLPSPAPGAEPSTFQLLLQDQEYEYDSVNNPTKITDYRIPDEWPESAKPVTRKMQYDDLYRVERVDYEYAAGDDVWKSPFDAENNAPTDDDIDPRRAKPSPHVRFDKRTLWQTFEYDWLGNNKVTKDDANGFYDRSLGEIENDEVTGAAYRMLGAASENPRAGGTDWLDVEYDACGSMRAVTVSRGGDCLGGTCSQHYVYEWDEVGRLSRARRWDATVEDIGAYATAAADPSADADEYAGLADVELGYIYDGSDQRVVKTAIDANNNEIHSAYIFSCLELKRAQYKTAQGESAPDYELSELTEVPYLFAGGVRLARVVFEPVAAAVPSLDGDTASAKYGRGSKLHVFFELGDHLGSSSLVLDQQTSELVEATTYQAYGATESDYRPDRWANFREDYRFTGKEEDVEVGLQYFGKRYLNPLLGRWVSADPLAVHVPGAADLNLYAYVHGRVLQAIDPIGLAEQEIGPAGATYNDETGEVYVPLILRDEIYDDVVRRGELAKSDKPLAEPYWWAEAAAGAITGAAGAAKSLAKTAGKAVIKHVVKPVLKKVGEVGKQGVKKARQAIQKTKDWIKGKTTGGKKAPEPDGGFTADLRKTKAKSRSGHRNAGNKQLHDEMKADPKLRKQMEKKHGDDVVDRTSTSGKGRKNPKDTEWDHNNTDPNKLDLRTKKNHAEKSKAEGDYSNGGGYKKHHKGKK